MFKLILTTLLQTSPVFYFGDLRHSGNVCFGDHFLSKQSGHRTVSNLGQSLSIKPYKVGAIHTGH